LKSAARQGPCAPSPPGRPPLKKGAKLWLKLRPHCQGFLSKSMCAKGANEADWLGDHVP